jgi:hypothetical protein
LHKDVTGISSAIKAANAKAVVVANVDVGGLIGRKRDPTNQSEESRTMSHLA